MTTKKNPKQACADFQATSKRQTETESIQCVRDRKMSDFNIEKDYSSYLIQDYRNNRKVKQGFSRLFTLCKSTKFGL